MAVYSRRQLTGSTNGLQILVTATSEAGAQEIHTVEATATNVLELVSLWGALRATGASPSNAQILVFTSSATSVFLRYGLESAGSLTAPDNPVQKLLDGNPFTATTSVISAYSTGTEGFWVWGHVDRIAT